MVTTNRIVCIWYNNPFLHPQSLPTGSFVFDTTIHIDIDIHAHHSHDHLYSIQWSSLTSNFLTTMIVHIRYNDPLVIVIHLLLPVLIPIVPQRGLDLQHLCLALVSSNLLKPNDSMNLANFGLSRGLVKMSDMSVHTSLEFFHLRPPHRWNDIVDQCASSLHGIYCPLLVRWLLDCRMRWWAVFLLLLESLS